LPDPGPHQTVPPTVDRITAIILMLVVVVLVTALVAGGWILAAGSRCSPSQPQLGQTGASDLAAPQAETPPAASLGRTSGPRTFRPTSRTAKLQVLDCRYFTVGYDNDRRNPAWVAYDLDGPITHPGPEAKRPAQFATDERTTAKVRHSDYTNSGFDRGHLCPAYAMFSRYGEEGERATFICTNIIPQPHALNAGWWENLEQHIAGRDGTGSGWAGSLRHLTVINGPVYRSARHDLPSGVEVPDACFAIVFDYVEDTGAYRALAFEIPDLPTATGALERYLVSIERIEADTGLDVYDGVDAPVRVQTERAVATGVWP
jgi:endonuclease G